MKKACFALLANLFLVTGFAQVDKLVVDENKRPLILVNGFQTDLHSMIFAKGKIKSVDVIKDSSAKARYGNRAQYGAIIIKTQPINFMRLNALLNRFQIADSLKHLRVLINESLVKYPELLLADETEVEKIETYRTSMFDKGLRPKDETFLNIITKKDN